MIKAVIMAGGKGTRMGDNIEKPLVKLNSIPLISYVINNISDSEFISEIFVATSPNTTKTHNFLCNKFKINSNSNNDTTHHPTTTTTTTNPIKSIYGTYTNINIIKTPGNGYIEDLRFLLDFFENISNNDIIVFINSDLPLVKSDIIDLAISKYIEITSNNPNDSNSNINSNNESNKYNNYNLIESVTVMVPVDIYNENSLNPSFEFDGLVPSGLNILASKNKVQNEKKIVIPKIELALNINTKKDLEIASKLV